MINLGKLKKIKSNFPVLVAEKAIPKNICKNLTSEISTSRAFDDMIMGGRSRINKGSKNFKKYLKYSKHSKKLFKKFNWPIIDVTRKSVEETAASIIKTLDILNSR